MNMHRVAILPLLGSRVQRLSTLRSCIMRVSSRPMHPGRPRINVLVGGATIFSLAYFHMRGGFLNTTVFTLPGIDPPTPSHW